MQSVMIVLFGIGGMTFGWFVYSKFIATKIYSMTVSTTIQQTSTCCGGIISRQLQVLRR
jgi:hypothetical protein